MMTTTTPTASPLNDVEKQILRPVLMIAALFSPILNLLVLTSSLYMMQVFDRVLTSQSLDTLLYLTIIALAATALMAALENIRSKIMTRLGLWAESRLAAEGITRAVEATLLGKTYRSEILRDLATLRNFFTNSATINLFDVPSIPLFMIAVFMLNWKLGGLALIGALGLAALAWLNDRVTRSPLEAAGKNTAKAFKQADAAIRNAEVVDVMGLTPALVQQWQQTNQKALDAGLDAADRSGRVVSLTKFVRIALQIIIMAVGAYLTLNRELTSGGTIAASIIIARALAPIEGAIGSWKFTFNAWQAYNRLKDAFATPLARSSSMALPKPKGQLMLENVTFTPPLASAPVIKGVSFSMPAGHVTAIIGPSAAGKSTLARLCIGAYLPEEGNVRLDGADIFLWNRDDLSPHIGYLPQDVELFSGTVRQNIARLAPSNPADVVTAAEAAGAHAMILRLPQGYETEIGEGGALLSGGQRQRIALARALYRNPQFVVMDEPNSSLDAEGEEALNRAIAALKLRGASVLLIGHRPSILTHVDSIIVLRDGRIELMGPRDQVLAKIMPAAAPRIVTPTTQTQIA